MKTAIHLAALPPCVVPKAQFSATSCIFPLLFSGFAQRQLHRTPICKSNVTPLQGAALETGIHALSFVL